MRYNYYQMNISVFCASSDNIPASHIAQARLLGEWIATEGHTLVYGGAKGGLMDAVAEGTASAGGEIIGIIPDSIAERGRSSSLPTSLLRVADLSERKQMLMEYADVAIALPGGFGTLDEMFSAISARKVGEADATTIIFNFEGFYDHLLAHIRHLTEMGIANPAYNECYMVATTLNEITEIIESI